MDAPEDGAAAPVFRPRVSKRRKIVFRKRQADSDDEEPPNEVQNSLPSLAAQSEVTTPEECPQSKDGLDDQASGRLSLAEILRQRRMAKPRKGGLHFSSNTRRPSTDMQLPTDVDAMTDNPDPALNPLQSRFAKQTGQVAGLYDKQMNEYVDRKMAELHGIGAVPQQPSSSTALVEPQLPPSQFRATRQPATMGRLVEVDLGPSERLQNIARTEEAYRRLEGEQTETVNVGKKTRIGPDGKPWRSRKRRNSEDLRRDQAVEEFAHEAKLGHYDHIQDILAMNPEGDEALDAILADQFRQDFIDRAESKRRGPLAPPPAGKGEEKPKGPKLGGSRMARAAMRQQEEKAAAKK